VILFWTRHKFRIAYESDFNFFLSSLIFLTDSQSYHFIFLIVFFFFFFRNLFFIILFLLLYIFCVLLFFLWFDVSIIGRQRCDRMEQLWHESLPHKKSYYYMTAWCLWATNFDYNIGTDTQRVARKPFRSLKLNNYHEFFP
jgi:hypothetical protein